MSKNSPHFIKLRHLTHNIAAVVPVRRPSNHNSTHTSCLRIRFNIIQHPIHLQAFKLKAHWVDFVDAFDDVSSIIPLACIKLFVVKVKVTL
jgi:hypothetical protein